MFKINTVQTEKLKRSMYERLWQEAHFDQLAKPPIDALDATLTWLDRRGVTEKSNVAFVFRMCALSEHQFIHAPDINAMFEESIGDNIQLSGDEVLVSLQRYAVYRKD